MHGVRHPFPQHGDYREQRRSYNQHNQHQSHDQRNYDRRDRYPDRYDDVSRQVPDNAFPKPRCLKPDEVMTFDPASTDVKFFIRRIRLVALQEA